MSEIKGNGGIRLFVTKSDRMPPVVMLKLGDFVDLVSKKSS